MNALYSIYLKTKPSLVELARNFSIIIFAIFTPTLSAQSFQTYLQFGNEGNDKIIEIETLPDGGIVAAGTFTNRLKIGDIELISLGDEDLWLARFDENLEVIWAISGGSIRQDEVGDLQISPEGSIFWTGSFWKEGTFGDLDLNAVFPGKSVFTFKLNLAGEIKTTSVLSGTGAKTINELAIESEESIFMVGNFSDTLFFSDTFFVANYDNNFFVAKMNSGFETEWFRQVNGSGFSNGNTISILPSGEIIAAGEFIGEMYLGQDSIETRTPDEDIFYAKFLPSGEPVFLKRAGGVFPGFCKKSVADSNGNFYLAGTHRGVIKTEDDFQIQSQGQNDNFYILAFREDGTAIWGRSLGSLGNDESTDLELLDNQLFISGFYENDMEIDSKNIPVGEGFFNAFFAAFSKNTGNLNWIQTTTGDEFQTGNCIAPFSAKAVAAGFDFSKETEIENEPFSTRGFFDFFITKINTPEPVSTKETTEFQFSIYPNPATDFLFIETESSDFQIDFFTSSGAFVKRFSNQNKISLKDLPRGLLFYKIVNSKGEFSFGKIVKR